MNKQALSFSQLWIMPQWKRYLYELAQKIQDVILKTFDITLEIEVNVIP